MEFKLKRIKGNNENRKEARIPVIKKRELQAPCYEYDPLWISDQQNITTIDLDVQIQGSQNSHWVCKLWEDARAYELMNYNIIIKQSDY